MKYFISYIIDYGKKFNPSYGNSVVELGGFLHSTQIDEIATTILEEYNNKRDLKLEPKAQKIIILNFKLIEERGNGR